MTRPTKPRLTCVNVGDLPQGSNDGAGVACDEPRLLRSTDRRDSEVPPVGTILTPPPPPDHGPRRSIRARWVAEVYRTALVTDSTKLLLVLLAEDMREDGYVSVPREVLAKRLGRNERKVSARLESAVTARLLDRVVRGNRGRTAVYRALLPGVERLPVSDTLSQRKPAGSKHPSVTENRHPMDPNSGPPGGPTSSKHDETRASGAAAAVTGPTSELHSMNDEVEAEPYETEHARELRARARRSWGMSEGAA